MRLLEGMREHLVAVPKLAADSSDTKITPQPRAKKKATPPKKSGKSATVKPKPARVVSKASAAGLRPDTPVQIVKGVGPKTAQALPFQHRDLEDLLRFLPRRRNRQTGAKIAQLEDGSTATIEGEVITKDFRRMRGRRTLDVVIGDETGHLYLKWFRVPGDPLLSALKREPSFQHPAPLPGTGGSCKSSIRRQSA